MLYKSKMILNLKKRAPTPFYCKKDMGMTLRSGNTINCINTTSIYKDVIAWNNGGISDAVLHSPYSKRCAILNEFLQFLDTHMETMNEQRELILIRHSIKEKIIKFIDLIEHQFNDPGNKDHIPADGLCGCNNRHTEDDFWNDDEGVNGFTVYGVQKCSINEYETAEKEMFEKHGPGFFEVFEPINPPRYYAVFEDHNAGAMHLRQVKKKVWVQTPHVSNMLFKAEMENRHNSRKHCMFTKLDALYMCLEAITRPHSSRKSRRF